MNTLDLVRYAAFREKISPEILTTELSVPAVTHSQILQSHFIDIAMASTCSLLIQASALATSQMMMGTKSLKVLALNVSMTPVLLMSFPFILGCYFFFSYFFNEGQSFGMSRQKIRVDLSQHDFIGALDHAIQSLKVVLSFGFYIKKVSATYLPQDHLYRNMMAQEASEHVVLHVEQEFIEEYKQAA